MSLKSIVGVARPGSPSLRATIPEGMVAFLELKEGDKIEWKMQVVDNERVAVVKKMMSDEEAERIARKYAKPKEQTKNG